MPVLSLLSIAIVGFLGYLWLTRGFFSALLNLLCTIVAGAVAFAVWEPIAYWLLGSARDGYGLRASFAWGVSLGLPFAAVLALLRVGIDRTIRANVKIPQAANYIGGAACGVASGIIVAGVFVLSVGFLRVEKGFWGHQPLDLGPTGAVQRSGGLWVPVDKLTAGFYGTLSRTSFSTDTPMAELYPHLEENAAGLRMTDGEGNGRNTIRPNDFEIKHRYVLDVKGKAKLDEILTDKWGDEEDIGAQKVSDLDGNTPPANSRIEGIVVAFNSGASEKFGQIVISNGAIWLVCDTPTGPERLHPIAVAAAGQAVAEKTKETLYGRFRFNTRAGLHIASVGSAAAAPMAFEFVVPAGWTPHYAYVRNVRTDISGIKPVEFASVEERDNAIESAAILSGGGSGGATIDPATLDHSQKVVIGNGRRAQPNTFNEVEGVQISNALGFTLQRGTATDSLDIDKDNENKIRNGVAKLTPEQVSQGNVTDRKLRVDRFATTDDTAIVQLNVAAGQTVNLLMQSITNIPIGEDTPYLVDAQNRAYPAVGYIYQSRDWTTIRFTPGRTIRSLGNDLEAGDQLSTSRSDQRMRLVFRVNLNAEMKYFVVGKKVIAEYNPGFTPSVRQR
jgi:hypothetical protein